VSVAVENGGEYEVQEKDIELDGGNHKQVCGLD